MKRAGMWISFQKILCLELCVSSKQEHNENVTGADLKVLPNEQHKDVLVYYK